MTVLSLIEQSDTQKIFQSMRASHGPRALGSGAPRSSGTATVVSARERIVCSASWHWTEALVDGTMMEGLPVYVKLWYIDGG